jgi:hypothetical protein
MRQDKVVVFGAGVQLAQEEVLQMRIEIETLRQERDALRITVSILSRDSL